MGRHQEDIIASFVLGILMVLVIGVLSLFAVHFGEQHQDRFVDDLTSPEGFLWLGFVTVYVVLRLWQSRQRFPK